MKIHIQHLVILGACLIVCAGCGSGFWDHEIDVAVEPEPGGIPGTAFRVGISGTFIQKEDIGKIQLQSTDSNGVVRIVYHAMSTAFVWQKRPPCLDFNLYIPNVSTNGYFHFYFEGCGKGNVRASYKEFTRHNGDRPLPNIRSEVRSSARGGYHVKLNLLIRALRDSMAAEFVPYPWLTNSAKVN
jgi:hypothetical protein